MKRHSKSGEFELLAARIEETMSPPGTRIKSPDRIRDKVTGNFREVDASLRYTIGSVEMLVTIECRDRSRAQDQTWIEQLATKRMHIGADRTIAVSATDFSPQAVKAAHHHGISLRKITDLNLQDETTVVPKGIEATVQVMSTRLVQISFVWSDHHEVPPALDQKTTEALASSPRDAKVLELNGRGVSINEMLQSAKSAASGVDEPGLVLTLDAAQLPVDPLEPPVSEVPLNGGKIRKEFTLLAQDHEQLFVNTLTGRKRIRGLLLMVEAELTTERVPPSRVSEYIGDQGVINTFRQHEILLEDGKSIRVFSHSALSDPNKS